MAPTIEDEASSGYRQSGLGRSVRRRQQRVRETTSEGSGSEQQQPDQHADRERDHDERGGDDGRIDPATGSPGEIAGAVPTRRAGVAVPGAGVAGRPLRGRWDEDTRGGMPAGMVLDTCCGHVTAHRVGARRAVGHGIAVAPGHCGMQTFQSSPDFCKLIVTSCWESGELVRYAVTSTTALSPPLVIFDARMSPVRTNSLRPRCAS